jgi:kumamolisin
MNDRKIFQDSVVAIPTDRGLTIHGMMVNAATAEHKSEKMTLHFSFSLPPEAKAKLEDLVARGKTVSPEEMRSYAPAKEDIDKVAAWLKGEGFKILDKKHDGASLYARATVGQIEKSLAVKMVRVTREGTTSTAAQNAPSMPADIGAPVQAIIGLQPFRHAHKNFCRSQFTRTARVKTFTASAATPAQNISNSPPYLVSEILKAYRADNLGVSGKGQAIAILIDTLPTDSDLQAFWQANGLSVTLAQITKINVQNTSDLPLPEGEETLDVSWSSGIAPGAEIRVYASGSLQFVDLDATLDQIIADVPTNPGMRQLSISLGLGETFMGGADGEVTTQHQKFLKLAALGVNVFVSSGDAGSNPDDTGHSATGPTQAEYSASDSCVIGVGGTSLQLAGDGSVASETGWSASGGGRSIFFDRPSWQTGAGVPSGTQRLVPDVSLAADPAEGAFLIFQGSPEPGTGIGGTSWSAPVWAGFCALINEARANAGKPPLPFLNPLIYALLGNGAFRDITSGSNGAFQAQAGYDLVTGIGVPNVRQLLQNLTA